MKKIISFLIFLAVIPVFVFMLIGKFINGKRIDEALLVRLKALRVGDTLLLNGRSISITERVEQNLCLFFDQYGLGIDFNKAELFQVLSEENGQRQIRSFNRKRWSITEKDGMISITI